MTFLSLNTPDKQITFCVDGHIVQTIEARPFVECHGRIPVSGDVLELYLPDWKLISVKVYEVVISVNTYKVHVFTRILTDTEYNAMTYPPEYDTSPAYPKDQHVSS